MKRNIIIAILLTTMMLLGAVVITSNSYAITPKTGIVNEHIFYAENGNTISNANASTVTNIYNYQGVLVSSSTGASVSFNLTYGNYQLVVQPLFGNVAGFGYVIASKLYYNLTVGKPTASLNLTVPVASTSTHSFSITGLSPSSATVSFIDSSGFVFNTITTNGTARNVSLPSGPLTVRVYYDGAYFQYGVNVVGTSPVSVSITGQENIFGYVTSSTGATISSVNVVVLNKTSLSYNTQQFTGDQYTVFSNNWTDSVVVISSPGYAPYQLYPVKTGPNSVVLTPSNSTITTSYALSKNPSYLNVSITYSLSNSTPIPNLPNASVGSLYWQEVLDHFTSSYLNTYLTSQFLNYTNSTIMVGSYNYALQTAKVSGSVTLTASTFSATVEAAYYNNAVTTSVYKPPLAVKIFGLATVNEPGKLQYLYQFAYSNSSLGLASSSVTVTSYTSPIKVSALSSTGFFTLNFGSLKLPTFINANMGMSWKGLTSSQYMLNSTQKNTVFVVPTNTSVSINVSNAFYNPVTGQSNYLLSNFTWTINGKSVVYGYNISYNFGTTLKNTVNITGVSASNQTNKTSFTVYAYNGTPFANYTISYSGKSPYRGNTSTTSTSPVPISVPQLTPTSFSAYNSSLTIPGTSYKMFLEYDWNFTNFTSASPNATNRFPTPTLNGTTLPGNLTVTGVTGGSTKVYFAVNVTVTTPPSPAINVYNLTNTKLSIINPVSGVSVLLSGNATTDPYFPISELSFNWSFSYQNGTKIGYNSAAIPFVSGSFNGTWVVVKFNTLQNVVVTLKVTHNGVSGYLNRTLTMLVNTPRLVVNSIYVAGKLVQGSASTLYINVTNKGNLNTTNFQIWIVVNGLTVASHSYTNEPLNVSQTRNLSFTWSPNLKGSLNIEVLANNTSEPTYFNQLGAYTTTVSVSPPAYTTPLIVIGIIAVIVVIFLGYYRFATRGSKASKTETKPKIQIPEQKKLEKKK
ncbi:MAG: CARDB domain-containing protein [Thermoplasmata archaeon]